MSLVTIPGVPILRTGTYELSTGARTFAEEDLAAAAAAFAQDPAVHAPRIRIASLEAALNLDPGEHGGEPAFGWADALTVSANGQELLADLHVPAWLEPMLEWAYPSLSIEGTPPGWTSPTGQVHELVITAVALLGVDWPGVMTLDDFREVMANGPELAAGAEAAVLARTPQRLRAPAASLDADLVLRRFYDALDDGDVEPPADDDGDTPAPWMLWVRSMRFDDAGQPYLKVTNEESGQLYRIDLTVSGNDVTFGDFVEVVEQDVPVAAGAARTAAPLAQWGTREASRAVQATIGGSSMTEEQRRAMARALGLSEDATEADIHRVAAERAAEAPPADPPADAPADDPADPPEGDPAEGDPAETPEAIAARAGTVVVSREVWNETLQRLECVEATAQESAQQAAARERDEAVAAAVADGRIAPAERGTWRQQLDEAPQAAAALLASLTPGRVPLRERGEAPQAGAHSADADHEAYMRRHFPPPQGRGRVRHREEV